MPTPTIIPRISIALLLAGFLAGADAPDVRVDAIVIKPASPGPSTLCELKVRLKNAGTRTASNFKLDVKIDGQDMPVYQRYAYVVDIAPGATEELELNNFYSPSQTKVFVVQVTLLEAQWVDVKKEGKNITVTPSGAVAGLPTSASLSVKMPGAK
jgi:hypothetical protein